MRHRYGATKYYGTNPGFYLIRQLQEARAVMLQLVD